jgi:hypothetical protein
MQYLAIAGIQLLPPLLQPLVMSDYGNQEERESFHFRRYESLNHSCGSPFRMFKSASYLFLVII